jgi:hypothetical protein
MVFAVIGLKKYVNELLLVHQLGLGDSFICSGLVNYFCEKFTNIDKIYLPSYTIQPHESFDSLKCLYSENPKIQILPVSEFVMHWEDKDRFDRYFENFDIPVLEVDHCRRRPKDVWWYHWFYEQFSVPLDVRYKYFKLPKNIPNAENIYNQVVPHGKPYRLIHDSSSHSSRYDLRFTDRELENVYIRPGITKNLLDWMKVIENAEEIHVPTSSVFCLIDSLELDADLYYHDIRPGNDRILYNTLLDRKKPWKIIDYAR